MTEDQAVNAIKHESPGSLNWIRGMKRMIDLDTKKIRKIDNKLNKKDIDLETRASLQISVYKNMELLKTYW